MPEALNVLTGTSTSLVWACDVFTVMCFFAAALVLGLFDISLPRGDVIGVGGALDAVALIVCGAGTATLVCVLGTLCAGLSRRNSDRPTQIRITLVARVSGIAVAAAAGWGLSASMRGHHPQPWLLECSAVLLCILVELLVVQVISAIQTKRSILRSLQAGATHQMPLILAQISTALLSLIVFSTMGLWSLLVVVVLLLLIRQSYVMLLDIRGSYRTTVEVLVEVAEGVDGHFRGHAERTALIARDIAMCCGLSASDVERVHYAALLHDIYSSSPDHPDEIRSPGAASVVDGIAFFDDVVSILEILDGTSPPDARHADTAGLLAFIVAMASDIDATSAVTSFCGGASLIARVVSAATVSQRAKAAAAAIRLGYPIPAFPC